MSDVVLVRPAAGAGAKKKSKSSHRILPPQPVASRSQEEPAAPAPPVAVREDVEERKEQVEAAAVDEEVAPVAASVAALEHASSVIQAEAPSAASLDHEAAAPARAASSVAAPASIALQPQQPVQIAPVSVDAPVASPLDAGAVSPELADFFASPAAAVVAPQAEVQAEAAPVPAAAGVVAPAPAVEVAPIEPAAVVEQQPVIAEPAPVQAAVADPIALALDPAAPIAAAYPQLDLELDHAAPAARQISADPGGEVEVGERSEGEGEGYPHSFEPGNIAAEGQQMAAAAASPPASYEAREGEMHPAMHMQPQPQQQHQPPPLQHNPYAMQPQQPMQQQSQMQQPIYQPPQFQMAPQMQAQMQPQLQPQMPLQTQQPLFQYPPVQMQQQAMVQPVWQPPQAALSQPVHPIFQPAPMLMQPQMQMQPPQMAMVQPQQISVPSLLNEQIALRAQAAPVQRVVASVQGPLESDARCAAMLAKDSIDLSSYARWFERKAGTLRGRFFDLVEQYRSAQFQVCEANHNRLDIQAKAAVQLQTLWRLRQVRLDQRHVCGDAVTLEHSITHAVAEFDAPSAERAHDSLVELQRLAVQQLTAHRFLAQSARLQVELFLSELLAPKGLAPGPPPSASELQAAHNSGRGEGMASVPGGLPIHNHTEGELAHATPFSPAALSASAASSSSASAAAPASAFSSSSSFTASAVPNADFIAQLRSCIDVLFFFEKLRDEAHQTARNLWRMRARQRREQRAQILASKFSVDAILAAQPQDQAPAPDAAMPQPLIVPPPFPSSASSSVSSPSAAAAAAAAAAVAADEFPCDDDDGESDDIDVFEDPSVAPVSPSSPSANASAPMREEVQFRAGVRKWLKIVVEALYTCGSHADHQYVLSQVLRCRGVTKWASFLQFQRANARDVEAKAQARLQAMQPPAGHAPGEPEMDGWEWSEAFVRHFLSSLTLILSPLDGKQLKLSPSAAPPASAAAIAAATASAAVPKLDRLSSEEEAAAVAAGGQWHREAAAEEGEAVRVDAAALSPAPKAAAEFDDDDDFGAVAPGGHAKKPSSGFVAPAPVAPGSGDDAAPSASSISALDASAGAEWIVLDESKLKNALNADVSYKVSLNESDYADLLAQTPILPFVRSRFYTLFLGLARRHTGMHMAQRDARIGRGDGGGYDSAYESFDRASLSTAFCEVKLVLALLSGALSKFPAQYAQLSKFIAKIQCQIVGLIGEAWARSWRAAKEEMAQQGQGGINILDDAGANHEQAAAAAADDSPHGTPTAGHTGLYPYPCCYAAHGFYALLQKELDFAVLRLLCGIQHAEVGIKYFLSELPLHVLSVEAAGQALLALLGQARAGDYADSSLAFSPLLLQPWFSFLSTPTGIQTRASFASLLLNPRGDYIHVLMALTKLCTRQPFVISPAILAPKGMETKRNKARRPQQQPQGPLILGTDESVMRAPAGPEEKRDDGDGADDDDDGSSSDDDAAGPGSGYRFQSPPTDLPLIFLHELFHVAYLNLSTREEVFRPVQGFIVTLCGVHPLSISFLLFLCHCNFKYISQGAVALFESMSLDAWRPLASDMYILQSLLLTSATSPANELARVILTKLNFDSVITKFENAADQAAVGNRAGKPSRRSSWQQQQAMMPHQAAAAPSVAGAQLFFPPRARTPVLGFAFHRALLLMLADVRLASIRGAVLPSSLASSSQSHGASPSAPPPCPFTSFIAFPTGVWGHLLPASVSRRNSGQMANVPQPPPVEQHLQQQFLLQQQQQQQQQHAGYVSPPSNAPAFSSGSAPLPSAAQSFAASSASSLSALLAPASAALADVFGSGSSKKPIDPAWWLRMLALLTPRDSFAPVVAGPATAHASPAGPPPSKSWLSARWAVTGVDLEEYTNLVRRDPVLSYIQLQTSWVGADAKVFSREGWPMLKSLLSDPTFQPLGYRALHDLIPVLVRAPLLATQPPSPAMGAQQAGASPPMMALPAPASAASASSSPSMPPRIPPRPSMSGAAPPMNPFAGEGQMHGAAHRQQSSALILAASALPTIQQLGILRHLIDTARPRGMFSFVQSKNVTFEAATVLSNVIAAHMLEAMRPDCAVAAAAGPIAAGVSPLQSLFVYWSSELVRATKQSTDVWQKDHNLRYLYDQLCRAVLLFSDWFSGDARAKANALLLSPSMRLLFQFTGEQAMAAAAAATGGNNSAASIGAERRSGAYLELGGDVSGQVAAADGGVNALDEDVEIGFPFEPNIKPPRAVIESLVPPESIMTHMGLTLKECLARHPFATFVALLEETLADRAAWLKLGHMICRWEASSVLKVALKRMGIVDDRVRRGCVVRRWFHHCLAVGVDHPLLPLFWQMAFRLLFARMHLMRPLPNNMGGFFGYRFLTGTSGKQLMQQCREQLSLLVTLTAKKRLDAIENGRAGSTLHPSVYELPALFGAMNLWLTAGGGDVPSASSEPAAAHLNALRERLMGFGVELPEKFLPKRLASILLTAAHRNVPLWWDLVDMARLRFEVVSELANPATKAALDLVPTARGFQVVLPGSSAAPEIASHKFFHRYYVQQNYALSRYAPSPAQVLAMLKRKKSHEISTSSPSASSSAASSASSSSNPFAGAVQPLTEIEVQSVFRVTEYASPDVAKLFQNGGVDSAVQRALVASAVVAAGGAAVKRRAGSMGYWSSSVSPPPPMPVLGRGDAANDPLSACALQIPSVLLASLWDLLAEDSSSALQPLHHATRLFTERFSRLSALHRQLIDLYPSLYRNERAEFALSQPCKVGWGGQSKCRAPVTFHFSYTRAMRLKRIDESIQANRIQALACIDEKISPAIREEVSLGLCATLIAVQRLLQQILLVAAQPVQGEGDGALAARQGEGEAEGGAMLAPGGARLKPQILGSPHQPADRANADWQRYVVVAGMKWLFGLAELDSQLTMLFPPAHHFVHATVASLAPLLAHPYAHSVGLQERLLELLARHPALIASLAPSVRPEIAVDPHAYLQLFRLAILVRDGDSSITSVRVLRRFDIERWVSQQPPPPFATRSQLFTMCVQQLREEERRKIGRSFTGPNDVLCSVYADMISVLSRAYFPDLFTRLLRAVLEDTSTFGANGSPYVPAIAPASSSSSSSSASSSSAASSSSTLPHAPAWLHSLWRSLRELPLHTLEWPSITEACALVEGCMWDVRRAHSAQVASLQAQKAQAHIPPILTHSNVRLHALLGDLLHPITLFYRAVFAATHPSEHHGAASHGSATSAAVCYASSAAKKNAAWLCVWQCFSAFCAPDPPPLAGPAAAANPPAHPQIDAQQQTVLSALVDCMSILQAGSRLDDNWVMQRFWHSYREQITVNADAPFLAMLHHSFIQHTRIHTTVEAVAERASLFRPIPSPPLLDFHASWVLTTPDLLSFSHTLKQSIELHEREVTALMATETSRRDAEYAQQQVLAKGIARREAKLNPPPAVTRQDVRSMCQMGAKVSLVATFLSHLIAAADWSYNLQQQKPAPEQPRPEEVGLGALSPRRPEAQRVMPAGLYEPAPVSHPYELYDASPSGEYASTLLLTLVSILVELPYAPFNSHLPAVAYTSLLLPHVQRLLDTLMRLDWCGVFLVRLPVEAFQMRYGRKARAARENLAQQEGDENIFLLANDPADDVDDGPQTVLPSTEEIHAAGLTALDREVNAMQSLLEQVSMVLYSDRTVSKISEEVTYLSAISQQPAAASSSSPAIKTSLLSSLLTNPFAALVTSVQPGPSASASAASSSSSHPHHSPDMKRDDSFSPHAPHPRSAGGAGSPPPVPLLTDADSYGLVRPAFLPSKSPASFGFGQLVPRYVNDEDSASRGCNVATPIARVHYSFRLLARLCSPLPPVAYMLHPLSFSSKFFFLPLVLSLRKCRLYSEWLLSVFHGEDAPRPLMQETAYLSLATTILHALDEHHDLIQRIVGDEEFLPVIQEYMFCANLESRGIVVSAAVKNMTERIFSGASYQKLALSAFTASCRSIISLEKLATFLESVLQAWMVAHGVFGHSTPRGGGSGAVSHWQTVSATLQVPELSFEEFLFSCLNNGSILTLHVVALQQLMMAARLLSNPYAPGSAMAAGGAGAGAGPGKEGHMDAVPSTPLSSSLLDPLTKHTLAQPRTSHAPSSSSSSSASSSVSGPALSPILDPRPIQQRIDQLAQWLQKAHVKDAPPEKKESKKDVNRAASLSAASAAGGVASPRLAIADEDLEPVKLLVVLRTLLEWQGSLARAYLTSRGFPVHLCAQQQPASASASVSPAPVSSAAGAGGPRWSNPLLATLAIDPTDPFPLLASADVLLDGLQHQLLKWVAETRSQGGLMGAFGLANHHRFSVRFRILLRALHTFLLMHAHSTSANAAVALATGSTKQHRAPALHFAWDASLSSSTPGTARVALLHNFLSLSNSKPFAAHAGTIRVVGAMLAQAADPEKYLPNNPNASTFVPLIYASSMMDQLVAAVFPELAH